MESLYTRRTRTFTARAAWSTFLARTLLSGRPMSPSSRAPTRSPKISVRIWRRLRSGVSRRLLYRSWNDRKPTLIACPIKSLLRWTIRTVNRLVTAPAWLCLHWRVCDGSCLIHDNLFTDLLTHISQRPTIRRTYGPYVGDRYSTWPDGWYRRLRVYRGD